MENIIQLINNAIGWSILHSLWQGASIYIILFGAFLIFSTINADLKYKIAYIAQVLVFSSFLFTIIQYLQISPVIKSNLTDKQQMILYFDYLNHKTWSITQIFPYLAVLYALGITIQIILCTKSISLIKKIKKSCTAAIPQIWSDKLENIKKDNNVSTKINLLVSDYVTSPITFGFIRPLIVFPTAYINKISIRDAESILLHEVAHIRRYDYFFNIILITIETILFFNPFVWLISRHIKFEREQSCDDFVTKSMANPNDYAHTLLQIEILRQEYESKVALALHGNNRFDLFSRIKRINNKIMETKYTTYKHQLMAILCTSITLIFIAWINPQVKEIPSKKENKIITTTSQEKTTMTSTTDTLKTETENKTEKIEKLLKIDTSTIMFNNEVDFEQLSKELEIKGTNLEAIYNSPRWKETIKNAESNAKRVNEYFQSPEWKAKVERIQESGRNLETYLNSPEYLEKLADIERNAKKIEDYYNSPEYLDRIAQVEKHAKELHELYNSEEYKQKIASIEEHAKRIKELYNSPTYKEQLQLFEESSKRMRNYYENRKK